MGIRYEKGNKAVPVIGGMLPRSFIRILAIILFPFLFCGCESGEKPTGLVRDAVKVIEDGDPQQVSQFRREILEALRHAGREIISFFRDLREESDG
jgi:hypothetical protein